jgi:CubicO group peptidase (beta-lactamase class C family)
MESRFQAVCEAAAVAWDIPALAVATSIGGTLETVGVGCDADTRFRLASITKPFTTILALGLLDLEEASGVWPGDVRVRHLLSHTSGFDGECGDLTRFGDGDDALAGVVEELPTIRRWLPVEQAWSYANAGFWLTGLLCARRAGSTYEDALEARVLRPLGLESTSFAEPEVPGTGADAVEGPYPRARRPGGGLVSNAADVVRFGQHLLGSPDAARMRIVHGKPDAGVYGLGLFGEKVGDVEVWGHGGSYGGFRTAFSVVPDRDAVFAGLTNSSRGRNALREIEDAFFQRVIGEKRASPETVALPRETREALSGTYANSSSWSEVAVAGSGVAVTLDDEEHVARAIGPRTFEITSGERLHDRFDFPLEGFGRFGSMLAERVS